MILGLVVAIMAFFLFSSVWTAYDLYDRYKRLPNKARLLIGRSEAEARRILGRPRFEYSREQLKGVPLSESGLPYGGSWTPRPNRPVSSKVLVYIDGWMAAFIYVDKRGRVEKVQVSST